MIEDDEIKYVVASLLGDLYSYSESVLSMLGSCVYTRLLEHALRDFDKYRVELYTLLYEHFEGCFESFIYWKAWFDGAEGDDLVLAEKGVRYFQ